MKNIVIEYSNIKAEVEKHDDYYVVYVSAHDPARGKDYLLMPMYIDIDTPEDKLESIIKILVSDASDRTDYLHRDFTD